MGKFRKKGENLTLNRKKIQIKIVEKWGNIEKNNGNRLINYSEGKIDENGQKMKRKMAENGEESKLRRKNVNFL